MGGTYKVFLYVHERYPLSMTMMQIGILIIAVGLIFKGVVCFSVGRIEMDGLFSSHPILSFFDWSATALAIVGSLCIAKETNIWIGVSVFLTFKMFSRPLVVLIFVLFLPIIESIAKNYYLRKFEEKEEEDKE